MAVREGMQWLIAKLRLSTETVDNPADNDNFYTDEELQTQLDNTSTTFTGTPLFPLKELLAGNQYVYLDFVWSPEIGRFIEMPLLNYSDSQFQVQKTDGTYMHYGIDYTIDLATPKITFNGDQQGQSFLLNARTFNLNRAAAEVWLLKAGRRADLYHVRVDNHTLYQDEMWKHCMEQYKLYAGRAGAGYTRLVRLDERRGRYATFQD